MGWFSEELRQWVIEQYEKEARKQERRADRMAMKRGRGKRRSIRAQMRAGALRRENRRRRD
jgi:hypothetical protein